MKYLLVAVNASYSHTNLGVRSICEFVRGNSQKIQEEGADFTIEFAEYTINQPLGEILRGIFEHSPDFVLFSTYIWNAEVICKIIPEIKKLLPGCVIGAGGPEFGFAAQLYLNRFPELDFIMSGEGEQTLLELVLQKKAAIQANTSVKSLYLRDSQGKIIYTGDRELICDLGELPFPYPELMKEDYVVPKKNCKIYYYESSRGCPYSCSYCMSSLDKRVRFMPLERVYRDLQIFMDAKLPLVKFVDRTYNLQPQRYISIWRYILEHHNGITMFHFEIEAEYLSEEALEFLQSVPAGVMQFEIGVQSANKKTLEAVNRSSNIEKLAENVKRIPRTIHQHLDLIAGLPYEDLESFGKSFDFVMALAPDALQLGFLKVLHGTQMELFAKENNWQWMENPVYETFSTPYLSFSDILFLKDVEILVDAYYNSGVFPHTMKYIEKTLGYWNFFSALAKFGRQTGVFEAARRETYWFELLEQYFCHSGLQENEVFNSKILYEFLRYDFVLRGKQGGFPQWYNHVYDKNRHRELLELKGSLHNARLDFAYSEYEVFTFNVDGTILPEKFEIYEKLIYYRRTGL